MSGLPRRPFTPELPPPGGLSNVRQEAARRRRVRAIRVSAGGAATAAAAAAVVFAITGAGAGADVLKPLPPAGEPTPGPVATATSSPLALAPPIRSGPSDSPTVSGPQPVVTTSQPDDGSGSVASAQPAAQPRPQESATQASRGDAPRMTRYQSTYTSRAGARVCSGGSSSDDTGFHNGVGWCPSVSAVNASGGIRLTFQICRDATAGGRLTFASSREVGLVLRRDGHVVWSWAKVASSHRDSHVLTTPANGCWNWTLVWPGTTSAGAAAPRGSYSLTGASTAQEVSPDNARTSFTY
jgi:hypothetical protein